LKTIQERYLKKKWLVILSTSTQAAIRRRHSSSRVRTPRRSDAIRGATWYTTRTDADEAVLVRDCVATDKSSFGLPRGKLLLLRWLRHQQSMNDCEKRNELYPSAFDDVKSTTE
jgi:hypothetical protein